MSYKPTYIAGDWKANCARCGFTFKASELKEEWTTLRVCKTCFEPRHPQDLVRGRSDDSSVPWTRNPGVAIEGQICPTRSAVVGIATVGCALVGTNTKNTVIPTGTFSQAI